MSDDKTESVLVLRCPYKAFENIHDEWEALKEKGVDISFDKYLFGILMFGHNTLHKSLGLLSMMIEHMNEDDDEEDDE